MNHKENMRKIESLVKDVDLYRIATKSNGVVEYQIMQGECLAESLLYDNEVAVQVGCFSKDSVFQEHLHQGSKEILIVVSGSLTNNLNGEEKTYIKGEVIELPINQPHSHYSKDGCKVIAITIPPSEGYAQCQ